MNTNQSPPDGPSLEAVTEDMKQIAAAVRKARRAKVLKAYQKQHPDGVSPEAVTDQDFLITVVEKRKLNDRPLLRMRKPKTDVELEAKKRLIDQFLHRFICSECQSEELTVAPPAEHRLGGLYSPPGKPLRADFYVSIFKESEPFIKRLKCRHPQFNKTITKLAIKEDVLLTNYVLSFG
jgi:hypothetical protein